MPGFMPGIHALLSTLKTWMAGTSPAMTLIGWKYEPVWNYFVIASLAFFTTSLGVA
jgi:hypothetical protein